MRRIALWLAATITVVVLLFGYHASTNRGTVGTTGGTVPGVTSGGVPSPTSIKSHHSENAPSPTTGHPGHRHPAARAQNSNTPAAAAKTYTGQTVQTARGPVEVRITVRSGKIISAAVPVHPGGDPQSDQINSYAVPLLVNETVSTHSDKIDMVSGATITSEGYLSSLQSALDKAGI